MSPMDAFEQVSVPTVVSTLWRMGFRNTLLFGPRPLNPDAVRFVGRAVTVRTIAVRKDLLDAQARGERPNLQAEAVARVGAGEVLVVGMGGETRTAFMGDIMTTHLLAKGAAGAVLDGAVSDAAAISGIPFPVFCTGNAATPLTSHRIVVELDCPIDCAGVAVVPGDLVMGDANGVVAIPGHLAAELAETCAEREIFEEFAIERVRSGAPLAGTYPPDEATLAAFRDWRSETGR
ncbi:MAG: hypothetical protein OXC01_20575 [Immundisolibacterales bacterium]|nr:hypothetical protein [Immundisolibacterales bacterium]